MCVCRLDGWIRGVQRVLDGTDFMHIGFPTKERADEYYASLDDDDKKKADEYKASLPAELKKARYALARKTYYAVPKRKKRRRTITPRNPNEPVILNENWVFNLKDDVSKEEQE